MLNTNHVLRVGVHLIHSLDLSVFRQRQFSLSPTKQPQDQERFKSSCTASVAKHTKSEDSWSMFWCQSLHGSINFTVVVISCWWGHNICKASSWEQWTGDHCWRYRPSACTPQGHAMVKPSPWFQIVNRRLKQLHSSLNYFEPQPLNHQGCGISESCLPRIFEPFWIDAARPKQAQTFQAGVTQTFLICVCETSEEM